jgi:hypothetical protein
LYDAKEPDNPRFGWGVDDALVVLDVKTLSPVIRLFKLALHQSRETLEARENLETIAAELKKDPVDFVRDFLLQLKNHLTEGEDCFFRTKFQDRFDRWNVEWALGIPAAWQNPHEQQMYVDAARKAGILSPALVSEPEATATLFFAREDELLEVCQHLGKFDEGQS